MTTAKHTPGPWNWERVATSGTVTEYTLQGPDVLCRYWYDKPQTPDARLIAAAPLLLEALQEMYSAAPEPNSTQDADRLIKAAAAIKATEG